jgi:hypothetical protein
MDAERHHPSVGRDGKALYVGHLDQLGDGRTRGPGGAVRDERGREDREERCPPPPSFPSCAPAGGPGPPPHQALRSWNVTKRPRPEALTGS